MSHTAQPIYSTVDTNEMADSTSDKPTATNNATLPILTDEAKVEQWLSKIYLSYIEEDDYQNIITIRDFTQITLDHYPECYMPGNVLSLALTLSTKKHKRSDAVVLGEFSAQKLYYLGTGRHTLADLNSVPMIQQLILDKSKRWVIVPCSDGVLEIDAIMDEFKEDAQLLAQRKENVVGGANDSKILTTHKPETSKKSAKKPKVVKKKSGKLTTRTSSDVATAGGNAEKEREASEPPTHRRRELQAHGNHWGLLLIDKTQKVAHWIDSMVTLEKKGTKLKIGHMFKAGVVAGKILRAIDMILGTEEGVEKVKFKASTLKYVPQLRDHKTNTEDVGACGPFLFAFLEHIYANCEKMDNLKTYFPRNRRNKLRFDSMSQRKEIRRLVQKEGESRTTTPFRLTPELLHILELIPVERLEAKLRCFQRTSSLSRLPKSSKSGHGNGNGTDDGDDDDDNDDDVDGTFGDPPIPKAMLRDEINKDPEAYRGLSLTAKQRQAYDKVVEESRIVEEEKRTSKEAEEQRKVERSDRLPPVPTRHSKLSLPKNFTEFPADFADQKGISNQQLEVWKDANLDYIRQLELGAKSDHHSLRAALQVLSGVDFEKETSHRLQDIWVNDEEVFNGEDRTNVPLDSIIAARMKRRYDIWDMENKPIEMDYATMPVIQLNDLITEDLKAHKSIQQDRIANEYTYRALLFIAAGGSFKNEARERLGQIWILDSNVFTEGVDYVLQEGKPPKLLNADVDRIRVKMQVVYEARYIFDVFDNSGSDMSSPPDTPSERDDRNNDPPEELKGGNPSPDRDDDPVVELDNDKKRKRGDGSDTHGSNAKRSKISQAQTNYNALMETPVNFTRMTAQQIQEWVDLKPIGTSLGEDISLWHKKAILQKLFGGFDCLSYDDICHWRDEDLYFSDAKKMGSWSTENVVPMLKKRVSDIVTVDLRGVLLYYPESYLRSPAASSLHEQLTTSTTVAQPSPAYPDNFDMTWSDDDELDSDADADEPNRNNKRKRNSPDPFTDPTAKRLRFSTIDFSTMHEADITLWLDKLPVALKIHVRNSKTASWIVDQRARVWLTRIFTHTFQDMQAAPKLTTEHLATLRKWRNGYPDSVKSMYSPASKTEILKQFLDKKLMSNYVNVLGKTSKGRNGTVRPLVRTVELPDWSGDRSKWPDAWKNMVVG